MSDNQDTQQHNGEADEQANPEESQEQAWPPEVEQLLQTLSSQFQLEGSPRQDGWIDVQVPPEQIAEVGKRLRDELKMNYLSSLSAVDWEDKGFEVVYHLLELGTPRRLVVRARVPREDPSLPSVTPIWPTADWHEREAWDLMGIKFEGHPDLRRILMPEDWVGHPLRKDYVDTRPPRERQIKL